MLIYIYTHIYIYIHCSKLCVCSLSFFKLSHDVFKHKPAGSFKHVIFSFFAKNSKLDDFRCCFLASGKVRSDLQCAWAAFVAFPTSLPRSHIGPDILKDPVSNECENSGLTT